MATPMRSPERARRLFPSADDVRDIMSMPTPPSSNNSTGSCASSVYSYSSAGGSSTKSNVSSGQKRARRSSGLTSPTGAVAGTAKKTAATTSATRDGERSGSPRVTKALFTDAMSSGESNDDCGSEHSDSDNDSDDSDSVHDDSERSHENLRSRRGSVSSNASSCASYKENEQMHERMQQTRRSKPLSAFTKQVTAQQVRMHNALRTTPTDVPSRRIRSERLSSATPTPTRARRRSLTAAAAAASRVAALPDFCSPAASRTAPRKARMDRSHPMISPFIKGSESVASGTPVRSKAISLVPTSPLHSPTTVKLSKHMTVNLSMTSPVQVAPKTPQKCTSGTPSRQKMLGRREVLAKVLIADTQDALGSPFEDLEMLSWLGSGISAEVYKARSARDGSLYAVKKSKNELRSERERIMLMQEIEILQPLTSSISHFEHIVRYFQAWQDQGYLYLQMELCAGGTLKEYVGSLAREATNIPESEIWWILSEVAAALGVLHRHGIVHLDVKPDNIFMTESGQLKLGDFGMATHVAHVVTSRLADLEGDGAYMAKELLTSRERLPSADVFCLGIMLLELVTGMTLPASGDQWHELRSGKLPAVPRTYSSELAALISELMHPHAASRPSAAAILTHARVKAVRDSAPCASLLAHVARQKTDTSRELSRMNRSASFVKTPRKKRLSLS